MANETTKMGLIPVRKIGGAPFTGGQQRYRIASGATTAIFQGDLVTQLTAGTIGDMLLQVLYLFLVSLMVSHTLIQQLVNKYSRTIILVVLLQATSLLT